MSVNHIKENFRLKTNRGNHERLIAFILLYYGYQFIENLHTMDSRSQT